MPLATGTRLGPYEILGPLGAGGMGAVYRARDPRLGREVAIKVSEAHFTERFEREARAIAALNHPHICHIYDVGPDFLVMELIEGRPIAGPLPLDRALEFAIQTCDALDAAHRKGIVHRDLKPANILVSKAGIKLLDFGLAKTASAPFRSTAAGDETVTKELTGKNEIVGTLQYMSPEQLQARGDQIDTRTDIFSFGLVLHEMLTGKLAFDGPSPASVIAAILERPAPSVAAVAPPALDRVLQRCLAKDPDDRWQTARDLRAELQWIAAGPSVQAARSTQGRLSSRWPLLAVAVALLALAVAAGLLMRRPAPQPAPPRMQVAMELPAGENWMAPVLSPDGSRIALQGNKGIFVRSLDSLEPQLIVTPGGPGPGGGIWSPDGRYMAYYDGSSTGELRKVAMGGGTPQTIVSGLPVFRGAAWNTDGTILFSANGPIQRVSENGGTPVAVTTDRGLTPSILPDHRHFLFLRQGPPAEAIYVGSLDSKETHKITEANSGAEFTSTGHLVFLRGVTLMAQAFDPVALGTTGEAYPIAQDVRIISVSRHAQFSVAPNGLIAYQTGSVGRSALTWIDRSGKPSGVVDDANFYYDVDLAPDGKSIIATRVDPKTLRISAWLIDLTRGITSLFTPEAEDISVPRWSPDGKHIAYEGRTEVRIRSVSGSENQESFPLTPRSRGISWSPDGNALAIGGRGLLLIPLRGDHNPVLRAEGNFTQPALSPDGKWIAYVSNGSGQFEVYVQSVPGGHGKWQISAHGGAQPIWRPDGKELFYKSADEKIVAVPVRIGASFEAGAPKELFPAAALGLFVARRQYAVSPDGQRFLVNLLAPDRSQMILLQNRLSPAR
jgi:eukaryotic-like serine/threonine-protein kinase